MSNMKHEKAKRLAIYATFDKDGVVDDYILYCLNELHKVADDLAVVSNHELPCSEKISWRWRIGYMSARTADMTWGICSCDKQSGKRGQA